MPYKKLDDPRAVLVYSVAEVASLLHLSKAYVHRLRRAGLLPFFNLGSYKIRKQALEKFLEDCDGKDMDAILLDAERKMRIGEVCCES